MAKYIECERIRKAIVGACLMNQNCPMFIAAKIDQMIDCEPTADVAPVVHGSWDGTADGYADGELVYDMWSCSVCGFDADGADEKPTWKYCPNCGAKMDGKERQNNE